MSASVAFTLALLALYNLVIVKDRARTGSCLVVLIFTMAAYEFHATSQTAFLELIMGFDLLLCLTPLLCILALSVIHIATASKLPLTLMTLFTGYILVIISCGWLYGAGIDTDPFMSWVMVLVFAIESFLMADTRITNAVHGGISGTYGSIRRYAVARSAAATHMVSNICHGSAKDHDGGVAEK